VGLNPYQHLRRVLHLDGSLKGSVNHDFCKQLVRRSLPTFDWDLTRPREERLALALALPQSSPQELVMLRAVVFLEEPEVEEELLRAHPDLFDSPPLVD